MGGSRRSSPKRNEGYYYRYLKPGALAQLRDSKLTARSHRRHILHTQISLSQLLLPTSTLPSSPIEQTNPVLNQINNGVPSFALRINRPRCLLRKRLFAVTPVFAEEIEQL